MAEFYTSVFVRGSRLFVRGYRDGAKYKDILTPEPTLYIGKNEESTSNLRAFITEQKVEPIEFENIREARDFVKKYEDVENFKIFGNTNYANQWMANKWTREVNYDESKIDVMFIDIETETECGGFPNIRTANEKIQLITVKRRGKTPITFSYKPVDGPPLATEYRLSVDEEHMLRAFVAYMKQSAPDVICGWNIEGFDLPYMCVRIFNQLGEDFLKQLSPFGFVNMEEIDVMGRKELRFEIAGIQTLDMLPMYKKFVLDPRESYKLDFIGEVEVGEKKLDHSEYETFKDFYVGDWRKFVEYNIQDVVLVEKIDNKRQLLALVFSVAYLAKVNYTDVYSPIKVWESVIYNYLKAHDYVIPMKKHLVGKPFEGAYVKDTLVGSYNWVVTFDLTSMYPHLIMLCNMSPETLSGQSRHVNIEDLINKIYDTEEMKTLHMCLAANGQMFRKDIQGIFPILMRSYFNLRDATKKEMIQLKKDGGSKHVISSLHTKQNAIKVLLNSLYGALGNAYFRYYDLRIAEGITKTGQMAIRWVERKMNEKLNQILKTNNIDYVIASDTDSIMVNFGPVIAAMYPDKSPEKTIEYLDKICKEVVQPYIAECYKEMADYLNAYEAAMHMKRENLCDRGVFYKKKRYILNVWDSEGVKYYGTNDKGEVLNPEVKIMGIELVKSSTPKICRDELREAIPHILYGTQKDITKFHKGVKAEFMSQPVEAIASPRSVNDIDKWYSRTDRYISGTPGHVRAALMYNLMIEKTGTQDKYAKIRNGDKIKFVYLKMPNSLNENIIGFPSTLPPEFDLHKYVDYQTQFEKVFEANLEGMIDPLGWKIAPRPAFDI